MYSIANIHKARKALNILTHQIIGKITMKSFRCRKDESVQRVNLPKTDTQIAIKKGCTQPTFFKEDLN